MSSGGEIPRVNDQLLQQQKIEEKIVELLLVLEEKFRDHSLLVKTELMAQKELISRLSVLSERSNLLSSFVESVQFPKILISPAEEPILQEFLNKTKDVNSSNDRISGSIKELRKSCQSFDKLCSQLDMKMESPFITGDTFNKPIAFFIELISDSFKYFHTWLLQLRVRSRLIDPYKCDGIKEYKSIMEPSKDFEEYFSVGLTYCKCLRPKLVVC